MAARRVALIHDFLLDLRGAERVFAAICDAWPEADVFTAVYDERGHRGPLRGPPTRRPRSCSACGRPRARSGRCCRSTRTRSSRSTCAATTSSSRPRAPGRTACSSIPAPSTSVTATTRSATRGPSARRRSPARNPLDPPRPARAALALAPVGLDRRPAGRPLRRQLGASPPRAIRRYFGRESTILHPPVELARFSPGPVGEHYLVLAELMAHKRIDVAIRAFNALGLPLVVVGDGPEWRRLRRLAGPTVRLHRPALRRARSPTCCAARRRSWSPPRRSSGSPRSSRSPPGGR